LEWQFWLLKKDFLEILWKMVLDLFEKVVLWAGLKIGDGWE
jgi:hypothetical protein